MRLERTAWIPLRFLPLLLVFALNSETRLLVSETLHQVFGRVCQEPHCPLQTTLPEPGLAQPLVWQPLPEAGDLPAQAVLITAVLILACFSLAPVWAKRLGLDACAPRAPPIFDL